MTFALHWTGGRCGERQIEHADLNRRVEDAQRLIVSDVLLGLAAIDIRQPEIWCVCHSNSEGESKRCGMPCTDSGGQHRNAEVQAALRRAEIRQFVGIGVKRFRRAA